MKLAIIIPGDYGEEFCKERKHYISNFVSSGTEIEVFVTGGSKSVTSGVDFALISPGTIRCVVDAEKAGFDGIVLNAM